MTSLARTSDPSDARSRMRRGFTLAEVLIVVAIISVLVAIALPTFSTQIQASRTTTDDDYCKSAQALCKVGCETLYDGDYSQKTAADWVAYAVARGIPETGTADSSTKLTATVGADSVTFTYGAGSSNPFDPDADVPTLGSDIAKALSTLIGTGAELKSPSSDTDPSTGTVYPYVDMDFNYNYMQIAGQNVKSYLKSVGLTDTQIAEAKAGKLTVVFTGSTSKLTGVSGYFYSNDDGTVTVVSASGSSQTVPGGNKTRYYASLM
ncbi:MAG: type II secretion system protein [Atopobiaceae bacterium]|nr:type II secretion system GspH family protein [Atopobiaceae bacterium]MCH4214635.1 type II secretion system GspH family protein [Atopobiaceae bacterium]MCH4230158.1 type II secretion system GspH family protein [Atopobiaceae bacterium]MCH4275770.1 type II secretion system GspH family protein [Atopobiaceae bacterium]MCI1225866.1 type II secretion system GspH family protein [Atopobiaceae bacterium]